MNTYRENIDKKQIVSEEKILLFSEEYKLITYDDGKQILRIYDAKSKMWVTMKFTSSQNATSIEDIIAYTSQQISRVKSN